MTSKAHDTGRGERTALGDHDVGRRAGEGFRELVPVALATPTTARSDSASMTARYPSTSTGKSKIASRTPIGRPVRHPIRCCPPVPSSRDALVRCPGRRATPMLVVADLRRKGPLAARGAPWARASGTRGPPGRALRFQAVSMPGPGPARALAGSSPLVAASHAPASARGASRLTASSTWRMQPSRQAPLSMNARCPSSVRRSTPSAPGRSWRRTRPRTPRGGRR